MDRPYPRTRLISEAAVEAHRRGWFALRDAILACRTVQLRRSVTGRLHAHLPVGSLAQLAVLAAETQSFEGGDMPLRLDLCFEAAMFKVFDYRDEWVVFHFDVCGDARRAA